MASRPLDVDGSSAEVNDEAKNRALAWLEDLHKRICRTEALCEANNRMLWELGNRLLGKKAPLNLQVAAAQARAIASEFAKARQGLGAMFDFFRGRR